MLQGGSYKEVTAYEDLVKQGLLKGIVTYRALPTSKRRVLAHTLSPAFFH